MRESRRMGLPSWCVRHSYVELESYTNERLDRDTLRSALLCVRLTPLAAFPNLKRLRIPPSSAGNVLDYMYETERIQYAYTVYLRDTGTVRGLHNSLSTSSIQCSCVFQHGFALPPAWIRPVGEETVVMVKYLSQFVARKRSVGL
jgi:hypothetical protein